ncbi:MAG: hexameric tyrosine-coordinated heme protein [Parasphingorhabdus sp.]
MSNTWLPTLITPTPEAGYDLAIKLSRMAVKFTQPDAAVREELRAIYDHDAQALIAVSAAVATNFQTVAAANNWWRNNEEQGH